MATQGNCNLAPGQQYGPGPNDFAEFDERAYGPDITRNFELGAKIQWLGGALILNGAIFLVLSRSKSDVRTEADEVGRQAELRSSDEAA